MHCFIQIIIYCLLITPSVFVTAEASSNKMERLIKDYEKKWEAFYIPPKKCTKSYLAKNNDFKQFVRCKTLKSYKKDEFNELNAKTLDLIELYRKQNEKRLITITKQKTEIKSTEQYLTFKNGGTACPNKKHWERFFDSVELGTYNTEELDSNCFFLRENSIVFGLLDKVFYKKNELVLVKSSEGKLLWLEFVGVAPITSSLAKKPNPWYTKLRTVDGKILKSIALTSTQTKVLSSVGLVDIKNNSTSEQDTFDDTVDDVFDVIQKSFAGSYTKKEIKYKLRMVMAIYNTPLTVSNYNRCASVLVAMRKHTDMKEMAILEYMRDMYSSEANFDFPTGAAYAATLMRHNAELLLL